MAKNLTGCMAILVVTMLGGIGGCASAPEEPTRVPRTEWLQTLSDNLGSELCSGDQLFRACYPVSEDDCHERVQKLAATCENEYHASIPRTLSDAQRTRWGGKIGKCAGQNLYDSLNASYPFKQEDSKCQQALNDSTET